MVNNYSWKQRSTDKSFRSLGTQIHFEAGINRNRDQQTRGSDTWQTTTVEIRYQHTKGSDPWQIDTVECSDQQTKRPDPWQTNPVENSHQ